jgi:hypothetical protein
LNRRPADYETIQSSQIAEDAVHRTSFAPAIEAVVAHVEQVSEQVSAHLPATAAEVEQVRRPRTWKEIHLKGSAVSMVSSIQRRAHRGDS